MTTSQEKIALVRLQKLAKFKRWVRENPRMAREIGADAAVEAIEAHREDR